MQIASVNVFGVIYTFDQSGPVRISSDGDQPIYDHAFADPVREQMVNWHPSNVLIRYDTNHDGVCFMHPTETGAIVGFVYFPAIGVWSTRLEVANDEHRQSLLEATA